MRRLPYVLTGGLTVVTLLLTCSLWAQTPAKISDFPAPSYPGDSDKSIIRRVQWIEGAKKEGSLVWWGIVSPEESSMLIADFNKLFPFIKVDYWRGRGEEIATKIEAEHMAGRSAVDLCYGGAIENFPRWATMGVIERYTDIVPRLEKFDKRMYGRRGDWVMPGLAPKTPQYNTNLVSAAEAPKNWDDLLNPKWKGKLGAEVESMNWATLALAEGGWGVEKTESFLKKLKEQNPRFIQGGRAAHTLLITGEFNVLAMGNLRHVLISQGKKAPVEWVRANPVQVDAPAFILMKKAHHPNAARLFLEWQLSPPGLLLWAKVMQHYVPGITDPASKLLEGLPLVVQTEDVVLEINRLNLIKKYNKLLFGIED